MATRSLWRARAKFAAATTAALSGVAAAAIATSDDPPKTLKLCTAVPVRLYRDAVTAASIAFGNATFEDRHSIFIFIFLVIF